MLKFLNKRIILFLSSVFCIILLHYLGLLRPLENYAVAGLKPLEKILYQAGAGVQNFYNRETNDQNWEKISKDLEQENKTLLAENVRLKILEDENKALREQLSFFTRNNYRQTTANVLMVENNKQERIITLDKGADDGVKAGQVLIAGEGMAVGKTFAVQKNISFGYLITSSQCELAAVVLNQPGTSGLTAGSMGLTVSLNFIPQTEKIDAGSIVVTSGLEPGIPRGLVIGKITEVVKESNDLFQSAVINPAAELNGPRIVSIIIN